MLGLFLALYAAVMLRHQVKRTGQDQQDGQQVPEKAEPGQAARHEAEDQRTGCPTQKMGRDELRDWA